jgi:hypothetical protein
MLDKLQECVRIGEDLGADFVEARYDDLTLRTLQRVKDIWQDIQVKSRMGFAITAYVEGVSGFSFTPRTEMKDERYSNICGKSIQNGKSIFQCCETETPV